MAEEAKEYHRPYNLNQLLCSDPIPLRKAIDYSEASEVDSQLFWAADMGDVKLLQQSIEQGANVNFQHCAGTPLARAARRGHLSCVQALLDHGADINTSGNFNYDTCTALHAAVTNGHYEIAQFLLDHGADVHAKRNGDSTPLHDAAMFGHPDIAELLLRHGAQINLKNYREETALCLAASEGMLDRLRWVLEAVVEYYYYRCYYYNQSFFPRAAVKYLLDNKDKVDALGLKDLQDLRTSLLKDDLDMIKLIVEERPAGNVINSRLQLLKVLLERGADTEILDEFGTGPLENIITNNDEESMSFLVKHGAVVNRAGSIYSWEATPLHFACSQGKENILKILLENGADPNAQDAHNKTPLHQAASEGNAESVCTLLKYGAQIDLVDNDGGTPLHDVKTLDCAKLLVDHGADATAMTKSGKTVLFSPSDSYGEGACVQFLIDQGADPLKEDESGTSAFDLAKQRFYCVTSPYIDDGGLGSVKALLKHGAKLKETDRTISKAIRSRKTGLVHALLRSGSDINAVEEDGSTALFVAVKYKFTPGVELLLEEGADLHIKCHNVSPLHRAIINGTQEIAKLLLEAGAIPEPDIYNIPKTMRTYRKILKELHKLQLQDTEGNCLMHIECYRLASIQDLLEAETDTNIADKQGITPLHIVCFKGSLPHVKLLLENKADPNKKDINGLTPLHFAAFKDHQDVGALLLDNGADAKAQDIHGRTPAHIAAQCNSTSYLEQLLNHEADINTRDELGWTPLHQAERNGCTECVELLIKHGADRTISKPDSHDESKIPPHLLNNISIFENYESDEDSDDLGFGLFD